MRPDEFVRERGGNGDEHDRRGSQQHERGEVDGVIALGGLARNSSVRVALTPTKRPVRLPEDPIHLFRFGQGALQGVREVG